MSPEDAHMDRDGFFSGSMYQILFFFLKDLDVTPVNQDSILSGCDGFGPFFFRSSYRSNQLEFN